MRLPERVDAVVLDPDAELPPKPLQRPSERVYKEYGIRRHRRGQYEIDHLIPLELGGSNSIKNRFAEAARPRPGFHERDKLENRLHGEVCDGTITLHDAQHQFKTNWLKA